MQEIVGGAYTHTYRVHTIHKYTLYIMYVRRCLNQLPVCNVQHSGLQLQTYNYICRYCNVEMA